MALTFETVIVRLLEVMVFSVEAVRERLHRNPVH